jgi:molybdate transport system substrate-binding protein
MLHSKSFSRLMPRLPARPSIEASETIGKIVLFSTTLDLTNGEATLREGKFEKIAIANPSLAPYGVAAMEAMKALGLDRKLAGRFVMGNNITQTFQFVETGNAEVGFVALSQVIGKNPRSMWIVPQTLYSPIRQDGLLLKKGMNNETARAFMSFLKSPDTVKIIEKYGYAAPQ